MSIPAQHPWLLGLPESGAYMRVEFPLDLNVARRMRDLLVEAGGFEDFVYHMETESATAREYRPFGSPPNPQCWEVWGLPEPVAPPEYWD